MIFTLGHSSLTEPEFIAAARGVDLILDVRAHPSSRTFPRFNLETMKQWLRRAGIGYEWWPSLGGWAERHSPYQDEMAAHGVDIEPYTRGVFPKQRIAAERPGMAECVAWRNQGLYDFSWYMTTPEFLSSMDMLVKRFAARQPRVALVCSEGQWWRCHRSMLADYLTWRYVPCFHLPVKPPKREATPRFQVHTTVIGNRLKRYEPAIKERWSDWASQAKVSPSG